jgi:hypothetical protein
MTLGKYFITRSDRNASFLLTDWHGAWSYMALPPRACCRCCFQWSQFQQVILEVSVHSQAVQSSAQTGRHPAIPQKRLKACTASDSLKLGSSTDSHGDSYSDYAVSTFLPSMYPWQATLSSKRNDSTSTSLHPSCMWLLGAATRCMTDFQATDHIPYRERHISHSTEPHISVSTWGIVLLSVDTSR